MKRSFQTEKICINLKSYCKNVNTHRNLQRDTGTKIMGSDAVCSDPLSYAESERVRYFEVEVQKLESDLVELV